MGSQGRIGPYSAPMLIVSGEKWGEGSPWCSGRVTGLEYEGGGGGTCFNLASFTVGNFKTTEDLCHRS